MSFQKKKSKKKKEKRKGKIEKGERAMEMVMRRRWALVYKHDEECERSKDKGLIHHHLHYYYSVNDRSIADFGFRFYSFHPSLRTNTILHFLLFFFNHDEREIALHCLIRCFLLDDETVCWFVLKKTL